MVYVNSGYFDNDKPLCDYTDEELQQLLYGAGPKVRTGGFSQSYEGLIDKVRRLHLNKDLDSMQASLRRHVERVATTKPCPVCGGTRLSQGALAAKIKGKNIADCAAMQLSDLVGFIDGLDAPGIGPMMINLQDALGNLVQIGLGYLSLDRESSTLSGGEAQRVKMVRHLGSSLTDLTYVFDEPTIGLHPHDIQNMNDLLMRLRDKGNTVLVVEHKQEVIEIADRVVDMGPGAGQHGGQIVFEGDVAGLRASDTVTGRHLDRHQSVKQSCRQATGAMKIKNASLHNLRDVTVEIPRGVLTAVTGVAGSGKSSLIHGCLPVDNDDVTIIDQGGIRGSRRSNPATYTGILEPIRKAFARVNDVKPALFSANSEGACPECKGLGLIYTDLAFMAGVASVCEACGGKRYTDKVLTYKLRGRNIADVLAMPVVDAREFFTEKAVRPMLDSLRDVGLGYISLGQPLSTLSGGERQRLKLAIEMATPTATYVLDEPTSGLHMDDVDNLIGMLDRLVDRGRTVIVIEHNLDVVARADWVIDLGPGAGHDGGQVVFEGTPAQLVQATGSLTGRHLRQRLGVRPADPIYQEV